MTVADRRKNEREERRKHILDAAQRVFYDKGVDAAKMGDVAKQAQLGKGTLYLYFKTKQELLLAIAVRHQRSMLEAFERIETSGASGIVALRRMFSVYAERMGEPREHLKMVVSRWAQAEPFDADTRGGAQMRENVQRLFGAVVGAIERGRCDGSIRHDVPAPRLAMHLWSAVNGGLLMQLKLSCLRDNPLQMHAPSVGEHIDLILDAARPHAERTPLPSLVEQDIEEAG